jgi:hypothetical protein
MQAAWMGVQPSADPLRTINEKFRATAKALRSWGQRKQSHFALLFQIANEVILRFDEASEKRSLSDGERRLRAFLKGKCLALASLERTRLRQQARVRDLQEGDANSKYFHMKANARRQQASPEGRLICALLGGHGDSEGEKGRGGERGSPAVGGGARV